MSNLHFTPTGELQWPKLTRPDEFRGKSAFKTDLVLDPKDDEVVAFMAVLEETVFQDLEKGAYKPVKEVDGKLVLSFKRNADFGPPRILMAVRDEDGELMMNEHGFTKLVEAPAPGPIWGGTKANVSFTPYFYAGGVGFGLAGVGIIEYIAPPPRDEAQTMVPSGTSRLKGKKLI